jgi:hypothetical protein
LGIFLNQVLCQDQDEHRHGVHFIEKKRKRIEVGFSLRKADDGFTACLILLPNGF